MKRAIFSFLLLLLLAGAVSFTAIGSSPAKPADCCITFRVEDARGNPMSGFTVEVLCIPCPNPITCVTGDDGECTICNFPSGTYSVAAYSSGSALTGQVDNINCNTITSPVTLIIVN